MIVSITFIVLYINPAITFAIIDPKAFQEDYFLLVFWSGGTYRKSFETSSGTNVNCPTLVAVLKRKNVRLENKTEALKCILEPANISSTKTSNIKVVLFSLLVIN